MCFIATSFRRVFFTHLTLLPLLSLAFRPLRRPASFYRTGSEPDSRALLRFLLCFLRCVVVAMVLPGPGLSGPRWCLSSLAVLLVSARPPVLRLLWPLPLFLLGGAGASPSFFLPISCSSLFPFPVRLQRPSWLSRRRSELMRDMFHLWESFGPPVALACLRLRVLVRFPAVGASVFPLPWLPPCWHASVWAVLFFLPLRGFPSSFSFHGTLFFPSSPLPFSA